MVESSVKKASWWIENGEVFVAKEKSDWRRHRWLLFQQDAWGHDQWRMITATSRTKWSLSIASLGDGNREWNRRCRLTWR
jgi:hypothetical protein